MTDIPRVSHKREARCRIADVNKNTQLSVWHVSNDGAGVIVLVPHEDNEDIALKEAA
jgi:hypothetical protein